MSNLNSNLNPNPKPKPQTKPKPVARLRWSNQAFLVKSLVGPPQPCYRFRFGV